MLPEAVIVWLYATPCVQFGRLTGLTVSVTVLTVKLYAVDPVAPSESVAMIVKLNEPDAVGVPLIAPVATLNDSPAGRLPADTLSVTVPVPPVAVTDWLYAEPIVAAGKLAGVTANDALTASVYARDPVAPTVSVAVIVKLNVPDADGDPVIAPVAGLSDSPAGRPPAETL